MVPGCRDITGNRKSGGSADPQRARVDAKTVLLQSVHDNDPMVRTHAMEAVANTLGARQGKVLLKGLTDPAVSVRFAAAMGVGDVKYRPAVSRLLEMVRNPQSDQRVVAAAIYALHRMGNDTYTGQLSPLLHSELAEGRAAAATAMGKMGEPSAIGPLRTMLETEKTPAVRLAIVEALARLGDSHSKHMLESYAKQYFMDLRLAVIPTIGELRVPDAERVLKQLLDYPKNPPRVRVSAAGALGLIGWYDRNGYVLARSALENPDTLLKDFYGPKHAVSEVERSSLQQLGAIALGQMDNDQALTILQPFLQEHDPAVRVAAAMATLKLLSSVPSPHSVSDATPAPAAKRPSRNTPPRIQSSGGMDELEAR